MSEMVQGGQENAYGAPYTGGSDYGDQSEGYLPFGLPGRRTEAYRSANLITSEPHDLQESDGIQNIGALTEEALTELELRDREDETYIGDI